jgi:hypothetical protein
MINPRVVGSLNERKAGRTFVVVRQQLDAVGDALAQVCFAAANCVDGMNCRGKVSTPS